MMDLWGLVDGTRNKAAPSIYQRVSDIAHGIEFDLENIGRPQRISWPKEGSNLGVLVLPEDDGTIRNADQLFGNRTHCGERFCKNGFEALRFKCDEPANGGNGDGLCDKNDAIFHKLRFLLGRPSDPNRRLISMDDIHLQYFDVKHYEKLQTDAGGAIEDENGNALWYRGAAELGIRTLGAGLADQPREVIDWKLLDEPIK